jgi:uncharacterized membrane protein
MNECTTKCKDTSHYDGVTHFRTFGLSESARAPLPAHAPINSNLSLKNSMATPRSKAKTKVEPTPLEDDMVFTAYNYKLIAIGIALVVFGFAIMAIENQWDGFISLYISPVLIVAGFAELAWAIMANDPAEKEPKAEK